MYSKFIQDAAIELCDIRGDFSHDRVESSLGSVTKVFLWEIVVKEIQNHIDIQEALKVATRKQEGRIAVGLKE